MLIHFILVFALTFAVEALVTLALKKGWSWLFPCFIGNLCTNPLLNLVLSYILSLGKGRTVYLISLAVLELAAIVYEGLVYRYCKDADWKTAMLHSALCNLASFLTGASFMR